MTTVISAEDSRAAITTVRYQELHKHFRAAFDLYLKGASIGLAVVGVIIGYLLQAHLIPIHARLVCVFALASVFFGCICTLWAFRLYRSLTDGIKKAADQLGLDYDEENYRIFKVLLFSVIIESIIEAAIFVYFMFSPPKS